MTLGKFIEQFSHNNIIRLVYKCESGHEIVAENWDDVSMDWEVNKQRGRFRHYVNNEVLGLASIGFSGGGVMNTSAINIVIERLENQPMLEEIQRETVTSTCDSYF